MNSVPPFHPCLLLLPNPGLWFGRRHDSAHAACKWHSTSRISEFIVHLYDCLNGIGLAQRQKTDCHVYCIHSL